MNWNGFTWLLIAYPVYLLSKGRLVDYLKVAGANSTKEQTGGATGGW